ncbi:hypothetical protein X764_31170 [Mesorhizobium sp. LSHC440A00]|nr:hypothetical protein X764_31170 [Mesorhizobium sp. LSHC440A00]
MTDDATLVGSSAELLSQFREGSIAKAVGAHRMYGGSRFVGTLRSR